VVRGGKKIKKRVCRPGFKNVNGKCVKMSSSEKITRSRAQKRGAKKRKTKITATNRKRKKSNTKRRNFGM
jgi:hypothetical protein